MPRCCAPLDLAPCYASVLAAGGPDRLEAALARLEACTIAPCVTGYCPRCRRLAVLTPAALVASFPCHSAYAAHLLATHARLEATLRGPGPKNQ